MEESYDHLIKAEKAFENIQQPLMLTAFNEVGRKLIKCMNEIHIVNNLLNSETWKAFLHIGNQARMSNITTSIQYCIGSSSQ